jgi:phosphate transport system protein
MNSQIRTELDRQLQEINDNVLRMGNLVDVAINLSMKSLAEKDLDLAKQVVDDDAEINEMRYEIEARSYKIVATQQPAARDLRSVMAAFAIATDLERMGDHAKGIARIVIRMGEEPLLKPLIDLPRMADKCRENINRALDAYISKDAEEAKKLAFEDEPIDDLYNQVFRELLTFMLEDPRTTTRALYLIFAAHNLERIADRVTNIAERVVFITSGELRELTYEEDESGMN